MNKKVEIWKRKLAKEKRKQKERMWEKLSNVQKPLDPKTYNTLPWQHLTLSEGFTSDGTLTTFMVKSGIGKSIYDIRNAKR